MRGSAQHAGPLATSGHGSFEHTSGAEQQDDAIQNRESWVLVELGKGDL